MQKGSWRSRWTQYGVAVLAVAVTAAVRGLLDPFLDGRAPTLPFTFAIMVAAWYGGLGPGLLATFVSAAVSAYLWLPPTSSFWIENRGDQISQALFLGIGAAISALNEAVHMARGSSDRRARELRDREEAHRRILETASEGIWTLDEKGTITYANRSMAEMLGVPLTSLIGRDATGLVHEEDRESTQARLVSILHGERASFELRLRRPDGMPLWVHVSSAPIPDGSGRTVGVLGMFTDVSARHRAESELQRLLASEKRAREEAEGANRAKDDFLATVSHELRTPLNAMLGWLTMLRSGALDGAKTHRALEVIERNARSQAKLIEDLLDVSRMISGKLRIETKKVGLGAVIQGAVDAVGTAALEKEIRIERIDQLDPVAGDPGDLVAGDPERLKQIVMNLLSNALKFTPHGGTVRVGARRTGTRLEIVVKDSGQGIAAEFLPHVFDRFRQQDASLTRKHAGLGLGLAIVRHLAELHGGEVRADSEGPGKGSTFTVSLPALSEGDASALPRATPALTVQPDARARSTSLRGSKVLVVDDELDSLEMLKELLTRAGADVRSASSAKAALPMVSSFRPDLIVSDLAMPEQDGYDLLGRIRALPPDRGGRTPAIALTAHARLTDRLRVLSSGFAAYLAKPVEPDELIATARRVLTAPTSQELRA